MFEREHHQRIERVLRMLRTDFLEENRAYFGGGTCIALQIREYRESVDVDFLCNDAAGYRAIHEALFSRGHAALCLPQVVLAGELIRTRDAVRFFVDLSDGRRPVKCEIIREGYLPPFEPGPRVAGVTALGPADLMATKLLANADRGLDRALRFRDFFDLVMAASEWPQQAPLAMEKAVGAYRESAMSSVEKVADLLRDRADLREEAYGRLAMSDEARVLIDQVLGSSSPGTISRIFGR
jgi:hypothetical protein